LSVDEQTIPLKKKHSLKNYVKNKPMKWGWRRRSGHVHHFLKKRSEWMGWVICPNLQKKEDAAKNQDILVHPKCFVQNAKFILVLQQIKIVSLIIILSNSIAVDVVTAKIFLKFIQ
jgi:hypothetical protein